MKIKPCSYWKTFEAEVEATFPDLTFKQGLALLLRNQNHPPLEIAQFMGISPSRVRQLADIGLRILRKNQIGISGYELKVCRHGEPLLARIRENNQYICTKKGHPWYWLTVVVLAINHPLKKYPGESNTCFDCFLPKSERRKNPADAEKTLPLLANDLG